MPRNYKRKSNRCQWNEENLYRALKAMLEENIGKRKAAKQFSVPATTLYRRFKALKTQSEVNLTQKLGSRKPIFSNEQEKELANYILDMEKRFFGLTTYDVRKLAYELAEKNSIKHYFSEETKLAGKDWLAGFLKRNSQISIRKPEATSAARAMGFNKIVVNTFYELLDNILNKYKFSPDRIFNCDETGISTVSKSVSKILAQKGRKQVGILSSAERGKTVTVEICFSASGSYMPPMFIFPRVRMNPLLMSNSAFPGAWAETDKSGWMQTDIFLKWFDHFIQFTNASKDNPVLLLLDGHATHVKSIELIYKARDNGVIIICFPPHTTHRLQPLDVGFMKPLSGYYDIETRNWLRNNPGKVITTYQIVQLFTQAFVKAATVQTALNSFKKTGISPFNSLNFTDADFVASNTTDLPEPSSSVSSEPIISQCSLLSSATSQDSSTSSFTISPEELQPIPHVNNKNKRKTSKRGKTAIITDSPYKNQLEEAMKNKKRNPKCRRNLKFNENNVSK